MAEERSNSSIEVAVANKGCRDSDLDSSSMIFVSSPLNGDNYLVWRRAMHFSLGARMKLSFIDGQLVPPPAGSPDLDEWIRKDYLVITWILNNISKNIVDAFMYVASARCVWLELEARYGKSNGPMIYNLEREISSISQAMVDKEASHQLMQFLIGLNNVYGNVRSQILVMEPRPDVTKAFSMLLNVEKELQVQIHMPDTSKPLASHMQHKLEQSMMQPVLNVKLKPYVDKRNLHCEHFQRTGHTKETCFKLLGTFEWDVLFYESVFPFSSTGPVASSSGPHSLLPYSVDDMCLPPSSSSASPSPSFPVLVSIPFPTISSPVTPSVPSPVIPFTPSVSPRNCYISDSYNLAMITAYSPRLIALVKEYLHGLFTIKDLGIARYFVGCKLLIWILAYLLPKRSTFMIFSSILICSLPKVPLLLYPKFLLHPCEGHWAAALHLVRYLKGTSHNGFFFPISSSLQLRAYYDVDWGSYTDTRRSISGFCVFLGSALISWKTKKQATVSRSSAEVEYRSLAATVCELQWISYILPGLGFSPSLPIRMFCDNKATLHIMANPIFHERTKNLYIDCHVVRNQYHSGFVLSLFVRSKEQLADIFTKNLSGPLFASLLSKLDLFSLLPGPSCAGGCWNGYPTHST
ncbi:UNVERIFIED_CONTAM: Retrovirus-related Pol polyprotein from transposon RE2 [Sesamum calycinum]|uniref:Retrovirus-related Pol polyprotein from transposon RE2 n=1 Tax=Sesamum calycinum TaxID=2727403 RepID=A0AAW2NFX3_9LAMI